MGTADWELKISGWGTDWRINVFHNTGTISPPALEWTGDAYVHQMIAPFGEWVQP
jgi:hypothetical protein